MSSWQPIATWNTRRTDDAFFWIVPKTSEDAYVDSAGNPIVSTRAPHWLYGRYETWSALETATHWREPLEPPVNDERFIAGTDRWFTECQRLANYLIETYQDAADVDGDGILHPEDAVDAAINLLDKQRWVSGWK